MLFYNNFYETLIILYAYVFIYNITLFIIFWTLTQFISSDFKTIYSFVDFKYNFFLTTTLSIALFSIAGVPPFIGFFSKLLILIPLINSNFSIFFIFFFILLFLGLYFYLQNLRFLYSTGKGSINYSFITNIKVSLLFINHSYAIIFFLVFGMFFLDDLLLYFYWLFS